MDRDTVQLGLLLETAKTQQQLVDALLEKLKGHITGLDALTRDEIRQALGSQFASVREQSGRALEDLQRLKRAANLRIALWSVGISAASLAIALVVAWWLLPSRAEIEELRTQRDQLTGNVALLEQHGAHADLRRCGEHLCIRVDPTLGRFGQERDYFVIRGY